MEVLLLTEAQVLALAPDSGSVGRARKTTGASKWSGTGHSELAFWGVCKGSGASGYQVAVDRQDFVAKCSCPSRKFPCKHALALMLIVAHEPARVGPAEPPEWVATWIDGRRQREAKKAERAAEPPKPVDAEAQAKRVAKRAGRMDAGIEELDRFLEDLVRTGLGEVEGHSDRWWRDRAKRLVDAQAPGLGRQVEALAELPGRGPDWPEQLLRRLGRLALLTAAWRRMDALPEPLQDSLQRRVGIATRKEDVLARGERVTDTWYVAGREEEAEGRLVSRRTWLVGLTTKRVALLVDYSAGGPLTGGAAPGTAIQAELAFYPGPAAERALVADQTGVDGHPPAVVGARTVAAYLGQVADTLAEDPFRTRFAAVLSEVRVGRNGTDWALVDGEGAAVPLARRRPFDLLAMSGGAPCTVFGIWGGGRLKPLSVWAHGRFTTLEEHPW